MQQQQELSWVLNLEYAIFLKNGGMVFSMLLCSMIRCRISTQCIAKRKDSIMNVMQLNTDIYNSLGVLSNTEWFVLEHNNAESCRHHCQQDSASVLFKQILHFYFLLNYSAMFSIRHPVGCNHREMNGLFFFLSYYSLVFDVLCKNTKK